MPVKRRLYAGTRPKMKCDNNSSYYEASAASPSCAMPAGTRGFAWTIEFLDERRRTTRVWRR